jgi:DNA-binding NarL/FixJ family response regulator
VDLAREGLTVAGVAATSADALRQAVTLRPYVVLVEVALGDESGFELARRLVADHARGAVILISTRSEAELADAIFSELVSDSRMCDSKAPAHSA